jgi:Reverse transcriptase (RNA-dependent DNA polymerase)
VAFLAERALGKTQKFKPKGGPKTLRYEKCDEITKAGLDASRKTEWEKWKQFHAVYPIKGQELQELIDAGHKPIPLQWVDVDKNEHKRKPGGPFVAPAFKSRLVNRGDLENHDGVRSDSPTCDLVGLNMTLAWAASMRLRAKAGDITNAYFQGQPLERLILLRPPRGGLPDVEEGTMLVARVPIYGTCDAGRSFWKALREAILELGFRENALIKAWYHLTDSEGRIIAMLATHVDDMLWACQPEAQPVIDKLLAKFTLKCVESDNFRFCGRDITQDPDGTIHIRCNGTLEKIVPVNVNRGKRKTTDKAFPNEIAQLRSVVGSLAWVSRQCRPDISYAVSKLQSCSAAATVGDLMFANKVLTEAIAAGDRGIDYIAGAVDWYSMVMVTVTDASWGNEKVMIGDELEPHRSQRGRVIALANPDIVQGDMANVYVIDYSSTMIDRVCRATMQAETYALTAGVEEAIRIRAALADAHGKLNITKWEQSGAEFMQNVWLVDANSLAEHLQNDTFKRCADKRLSVEIAALRQMLWLAPDGSLRERLSAQDQDVVRWIDTSTMIADCLTKRMDPQRLMHTLKTGVLDLTPTDSSILQKMKKQKGRQKRVHIDEATAENSCDYPNRGQED